MGRHVVQVSERVVSVDALRGFDMFWIACGGPFVMAFFKLFSNSLAPWLGAAVRPCRMGWIRGLGSDHALFLFVVGVAMPFSIGKRVERGDSGADHPHRRYVA